jgi:hypothetical protein
LKALPGARPPFDDAIDRLSHSNAARNFFLDAQTLSGPNHKAWSHLTRLNILCVFAILPSIFMLDIGQGMNSQKGSHAVGEIFGASRLSLERPVAIDAGAVTKRSVIANIYPNPTDDGLLFRRKMRSIVGVNIPRPHNMGPDFFKKRSSTTTLIPA